MSSEGEETVMARAFAQANRVEDMLEQSRAQLNEDLRAQTQATSEDRLIVQVKNLVAAVDRLTDAVERATKVAVARG